MHLSVTFFLHEKVAMLEGAIYRLNHCYMVALFTKTKVHHEAMIRPRRAVRVQTGFEIERRKSALSHSRIVTGLPGLVFPMGQSLAVSIMSDPKINHHRPLITKRMDTIGIRGPSHHHQHLPLISMVLFLSMTAVPETWFLGFFCLFREDATRETIRGALPKLS
ncbi:hypothetical protein MAP00_004182 [Monascus purpureus]|nr:hypothetical protein MAP00_004182 [Monascus purpureus]